MPVHPSNPGHWDDLAKGFAQAASANVRQQFTKHALLGLSDHGEAIIYGVIYSAVRQTFSAAATFAAQGFDISTAILTNPNDPPSPV